MVRRHLLVVSLVVLCLSAARVDAQTCPGNVSPFYYDLVYTCDTSSTGANVCAAGQPITFRISSWDTTWAPLSCATATLTFDDGSSPVTISGATTVQRTLPSGRRTVTAQISTPGYSPVSEVRTIDVGRGYILLQGTSYITEGANLPLTLVRANVSMSTTVDWVVESSGAGSLSRFPQTSGSVTLAAGEVSKQLTISITDDAAHTGAQSYRVRLTGATNDYLANSSHSFTVEDNDYADLSWADPTVEAAEDAGVISLTVKRAGVLTNEVSVRYETYWASPYVVSTSGTITFAAGETTKTVNVALIDDSQWTGNRSVSIQLYGASSGARILNPSQLLLTITDDEPTPTVSIDDISIAEGNSGETNAVFTIRLSAPVQYAEFSYHLSGKSATYGQDFYGPCCHVAFRNGATEVPVTVRVLGDTKYEPHEVVQLTLSNWYNPTIAIPPPATLTILNDEVDLSPDMMRVAAGETASFLLDIGLPAEGPLTVPLSFDANVLDGSPSVVFAAGESVRSIDFVGRAAGSTEIGVTLPASRGGVLLKAGVQVHDLGMAVFEPKRLAVRTGEEATVTVSLQPAGTQDFRLPLRSSQPAIAEPVSEAVTIPAGGTGTFKVKGVSPGTTFIKLTLPAQFGNETAHLFVDVSNAPPAATISSITPVIGPSAGGTAFEVRGTNLTSGCTVLFGTVPASGVSLSGTTTLKGTTPAHAAGMVDVVLQCGAARSTLPNGFSFFSVAPTLTSISPTFGSTAGGTHVRAAVTNVQSGCWMFFANTAASNVWVHGATEMSATTPRRSEAGPVDVSVRCGVESSTLPAAFAYSSAAEPSLSILSIEPLTGAPGESVTIRGSRLRPTDRISFEGQPATLLRTQPDAHVVRIPELAPGPSRIDIVDAEGRLTTTGPIFTIKATAPPYIASVTPSQAAAGAEVVLTGRGLRPGFSFSVGGTIARVVAVELERAVLRLAGSITPGTYPIDVLDSKGSLVATGPTLTITAAGVLVRSLSPGCDTTAGGARVTIHGSGFAAGANVTFNGVAATNVQVVNATTIHATAPAGAAGAALVAVTNANGSKATASDAFTYRSPFDPAACSTRGRSVRH